MATRKEPSKESEIKEIIRIDEALILGKRVLLEEFEQRVEKAQEEIKKAQKALAELYAKRKKAPDEITELQAHLILMKQKLKTVQNNDEDKIKAKIKSLKQRIARMEKELG